MSRAPICYPFFPVYNRITGLQELVVLNFSIDRWLAQWGTDHGEVPEMKAEPRFGDAESEGGGEVAEQERHRALQRQARALGDPSRYRIFRYVAEALEPVGVAAITAHVGLNHNGTRQHLAKLCDAGLLIEEFAAPGGPGRPALQYRLAPEASRFHPV